MPSMSPFRSCFGSDCCQRRTPLRALAGLVTFLSPRRRLQLIGIAAITVLSAAAEVVSIGVILPLLSYLSGTVDAAGGSLGKVLGNLAYFYSFDAYTLTVAFAGAALLSGGVRILLVYATNRF